jgi:hypothetical protein
MAWALEILITIAVFFGPLLGIAMTMDEVRRRRELNKRNRNH